jgi:hypothetical protein
MIWAIVGEFGICQMVSVIPVAGAVVAAAVVGAAVAGAVVAAAVVGAAVAGAVVAAAVVGAAVAGAPQAVIVVNSIIITVVNTRIFFMASSNFFY